MSLIVTGSVSIGRSRTTPSILPCLPGIVAPLSVLVPIVVPSADHDTAVDPSETDPIRNQPVRLLPFGRTEEVEHEDGLGVTVDDSALVLYTSGSASSRMQSAPIVPGLQGNQPLIVPGLQGKRLLASYETPPRYIQVRYEIPPVVDPVPG